MHPHIDPFHNVVIDLDLIDKGDLYNKYSLLVEQYRDLRLHARDLIGIIGDNLTVNDLSEEEGEFFTDAEAFLDNKAYRTPVTPALGLVMTDDDGNILTTTHEEDK